LYPKRHLLHDDAIDVATLHLWVSQGEEFTVEFLDYPGQTILVKWRDLQDVANLEIWQYLSRKQGDTTKVIGGQWLLTTAIGAFCLTWLAAHKNIWVFKVFFQQYVVTALGKQKKTKHSH
jgi:hypothetical protein